jgi:hypothetical protein
LVDGQLYTGRSAGAKNTVQSFVQMVLRKNGSDADALEGMQKEG